MRVSLLFAVFGTALLTSGAAIPKAQTGSLSTSVMQPRDGILNSLNGNTNTNSQKGNKANNEKYVY
jgi:hypothetical protein